MKVAYVQDWLTVAGGAERVTREIMLLYPQADVFSLIDFLSPADREFLLQGRKSAVSFIQRFPFSRKWYRAYLPLFPAAIERFDLRAYDLIISSSYAVAKGVRTQLHQKHICYCHSPVRYAWDLRDDYLGQVKDPTGLTQAIMRFFLNRIRKWDQRTTSRVTRFLANSAHVQQRIERSYRRESVVVYPPVDLEKFTIGEEKSDYYITASRLVEYKRIDVIIKAFLNLPRKQLIVLGDGPQLAALRKMAGGSSNIRFLGHVTDDELRRYLQKARAFIMAAHEDFGIAPIEAQACGTPVIAYAEGGVLETTVENRSAVLFHAQTTEAIVEAITTFEDATLWSQEEIRNSVMKFDRHIFRQNFKKEVERCLDM